MKNTKIMKLFLLVGLLALLVGVLPVFAQTETVTYQGQVIESNPETGEVVMETFLGEVVRFFAPEGFDLTTLENGSTIVVTVQVNNDGPAQALSITVVNPVDDTAVDVDTGGTSGPERSDGEADGESEGDGKMNSAYCAEDKKDTPHPFAQKLMDQYGVTEDWVMGYFCDHVGMGQIMLALITAEKSDATADDLLTARAGGSGWGQIWKVLGLVGPDKHTDGPPGLVGKEDKHSNGPPGLQNKPDHAGKKGKSGK